MQSQIYGMQINPITLAAEGWIPIGVSASGTPVPSSLLNVNAFEIVNGGNPGGVAVIDYFVSRGATVFHSVEVSAAGNTVVWTPTAGQRFVLMGATISVCGALAVAGKLAIQLRDGAATVLGRWNAFVSDTIAGDTQMGADFGEGQVSAALNNALNVNLDTALASGTVAINVWGIELGA